MESSSSTDRASSRPRAALGTAASPYLIRLRTSAAALGLLLLAAVATQWFSGAYSAEFSGYPDEPAHVVTSLMVREYAAEHFPGSPLLFAENYYLHYPKVGLGHWPPVFYGITALWTLLFPLSKASLLVLMALFAAATAAVLFTCAARSYGWLSGLLLGLAFVLTPAVQEQTAMVMLDVLLALWALLAALAFARFLRTNHATDSLAFGCFAALTILSKGNGWALAFLPPISIALTRRWKLLRSVRLWVAAIPVVLLCGPWQLFSRGMTEQGWDQPSPTLAYTATALAQFVEIFFRMSPPLFVLAICGIFLTVVLPFWRRKSVEAVPAALAALVFSVWIFHSVVPAGVEERKMIMGLPGLFGFVLPMLFYLSERARLVIGERNFAKPVYALVVVILFIACAPAVAHKPSFGFVRAADDLLRRSDFRGRSCLISSNADGEGLLISEYTLRAPRPGAPALLRATKVLAHSDWSGRDYRSFYQSENQMLQAVNGLPVDLVVLDRNLGRFHFAHHHLLTQVLDRHPEAWQIADSITEPDQPAPSIAIYRRVGSPASLSVPIPIDLSEILRRPLSTGRTARK